MRFDHRSAWAAGAAAQAASGCQVTYSISSQWQGGFGANGSITNLGGAITSWKLSRRARRRATTCCPGASTC